ncbi:unnamed protein product [Amoebophrya sp. A120]|nr:unnamed protein product [Amoebophrya sp. A120]|eukprot:GSA120T00001949001.1
MWLRLFGRSFLAVLLVSDERHLVRSVLAQNHLDQQEEPGRVLPVEEVAGVAEVQLHDDDPSHGSAAVVSDEGLVDVVPGVASPDEHGEPPLPDEHQAEAGEHEDETRTSIQLSRMPFDPSVPDFAAGSESSYKGDEEYMRVCMWTFRQLAEVCAPDSPEGDCEIGSIMAHSLQDQLRKFYRHGPYDSALSEDEANALSDFAAGASATAAGAVLAGDNQGDEQEEDATESGAPKVVGSSSLSGETPSSTVDESVENNELATKRNRISAIVSKLQSHHSREWNSGKQSARLTLPTTPPLESCGWIVLGTDRKQRESEEDSCPGLTISCLLLMAEAFLLNSPDHFSVLFASEAEDILARLRNPPAPTQQQLPGGTLADPPTVVEGGEHEHQHQQQEVDSSKEETTPATNSPAPGVLQEISVPAVSNREEYMATNIMWPVTQAFTSYGLEYAHITNLQEQRLLKEQEDPDSVLSLDVVIARCDSPMMWLWEFAFPKKTRFFIYEKCRHRMRAKGEDPDQILQDQIEGLEDHIQIFIRELPERDPRFMSGECTAYLAYILEFGFLAPAQQQQGEKATRSTSGIADFVAFIHDDGPRHFKSAFFNVVLQSVEKRTYDVPFLHLTHERYAALVTPCFERVFQMIFGHPLLAPVTSYCCSNFVVSRARILARDRDFYAHLADLIFHGRYTRLAAEIARNDSTTALAERDQQVDPEDVALMEEFAVCNVGHKPCYVMEFLWHVVFGEPLELPYREEDARLPLALRYGGGRDTLLPSALKLSPYTMAITPKRFTNKLRRVRAR